MLIFHIKITETKNPHKHSDIEGMKTNGLLLGVVEKLFSRTDSPFLAPSSLVTKWVLIVQLLQCDAYERTNTEMTSYFSLFLYYRETV